MLVSAGQHRSLRQAGTQDPAGTPRTPAEGVNAAPFRRFLRHAPNGQKLTLKWPCGLGPPRPQFPNGDNTSS